MASVELREVRKAFDPARCVLEGISFKVEEGEFVSLLGASGCGKTTLLRIIAGLDWADSGEVLIGGREVSGLAPKDRDIAMVFQSYALYPHLDVEQNIGMGLKLRGLPPAEISRKVREAAGRLGLSELLARRPAALSGGQRQRVALARALVREPKAFLLDEPLSNLDAVLREKTRGELKLLFKRLKGTVIYVTHDQVEAMTLSDRIVVLDCGRIQQVGTPEEIYRRPANTFVATFLGSPPMNLFLENEAWTAGLLAAHATSEPPRRVGVRPEDMRLAQEARPGYQEAGVELSEPLGPSTVLSLDFKGNLSLRASVPGTWRAANAKVWAALDRERLHFFEAATGKRIEP